MKKFVFTNLTPEGNSVDGYHIMGPSLVGYGETWGLGYTLDATLVLVADGITGEVLYSPLKTDLVTSAHDEHTINTHVYFKPEAALLLEARYTVVWQKEEDRLLKIIDGTPIDAPTTTTDPAEFGATIMSVLRGGLSNWMSLLGKLPDLISGRVPVDVTFATPQPVSGPLTDTELRATAVPVSGPLTDTQLRASAVPISSTALTNIDTDLGSLADAAASTDTGSFSLIALTKRILTKLPALVSGRIPVDGSGVTQPVSGPLTDSQLRASSVPVTATLPSSTGSTLTTFTSTTSAQVLAANSNRRGVVLSSPSTNTGICYIVIGTTTASATAFSLLVNPGDIINLTGINNALTGIWSSASQTLYVTELT